MQGEKSGGVSCARKEYCKKQAFLSIKTIHVPPFETEDRTFLKCMSFFLHCAPNIESTHSYSIETKEQRALLENMFTSRRFVYSDFCSSNCKIEKHLSAAGLAGDNLCLNCKRFVCKRKKADKGETESDFNCFLRHIRNSIAHGNVHYYHHGNRILLLFDDYKGKKLSARIVCYRADLEHWYKVLQEAKKVSTSS